MAKKENRFRDIFKKKSDGELIAAFNKEVGKAGWTSSRALYLTALHEEFEKRGFDYSTIGDKNRLSFKKEVKLVGRKIEILEKS